MDEPSIILDSISIQCEGLHLALDDHIYNLRREKLKQIEALGQPTYRSKYEFTHTLDQILRRLHVEDRRGTRSHRA